MPYLLRVELPDVPGSLGRVASAIGEAGGDIEAIEIVEKTPHGTAVDDVVLEMAPGRMPDSIVSACNAVPGVQVLWISRYPAGGNLFLDLEVVEEISLHPEQAHERLLSLMPRAYRVDWAAWLTRLNGDVVIRSATEAAPTHVAWADLDRPGPIEAADDDNLVMCGVPFDGDLFVLGRHGGPDFVDSEMHRLGHLVALATHISDQVRRPD